MINLAVIGCGYWGPNLIRNFSNNKNFCLRWCCDLKWSRLEALRNRCPKLKLTTDYMDIVRDKKVDAVAIATPLVSHFEIAKRFISSGKHVFVEKPFTHSVKSAQELIKISEKEKKVLMVGYTYLYDPAIIKIKNILSKDGVGKVHYVHSARVHFGHLRPEEGVIWDLAVHDLSIIIYWFGLNVYNVSCVGKDCLKRGYFDTAYLNVNLKNGPAVYIFTSLLAPIKMRNMIITGSKKMIFYNDMRNSEKIKIYDQCAIVNQKNNLITQNVSYRNGDIFSPNIDIAEPLLFEVEDFARCIKYDKLPKSSGSFGLEILKIIEAANKSVGHNKVIMMSK